MSEGLEQAGTSTANSSILSGGDIAVSKRAVLFVTTLATFIAALDSNIVAIALPKISVDLSAGFSLLGWVITGYLLSLSALILQSGKISDIYGRKKIYLAGFVVFGASSALCGLSQSVIELIAFRVVQGASASFLFAISRPLLLDTFHSKEISFAFAVNSAAWSVGAVVGPVIGGFLVALTWRLIFYVNVPIALLAVLIAVKKIPRSTNKASSFRSGVSSVNPLSSVLLAVTVAMLLLWLSFFDTRFGLAGLVALVPLFINETKSGDPLLNRDLRGNKGFVYSILSITALALGFGGISFATSFYFQSVLNLSPELSGVLSAPFSLALAVATLSSGRLYSRFRTPAILAFCGALSSGVALLALGLATSAEAPLVYIEVLLSLLGIGVGVYWTPTLTTALRFSRLELTGAANGTFSLFVTIGSAASVAITVAISASYLPQALVSQVYGGGLSSLTLVQAALFKQGIAEALFAMGLLEIFSLPIILLVIRQEKRLLGS